MKRTFLTLVLLLTAFAGKAQYPAFDTFYVYHPPQLNGCPIGTPNFAYYNYRGHYCPPYSDYYDINKFVVINGHVASSNSYGVTCVAQPYHFDSTVYLCGVAVRGYSIGVDLDPGYRVRLLDENFDSLASEVVHHVNADSDGYKRLYFGTAVPVQDFYLAGDVGIYPVSASPYYPMTEGTYDTCLADWFYEHNYPFVSVPGFRVNDNSVYCFFDESPYFKKNGQWTRFADDSVYELYQQSFIEILPVIMVLTDIPPEPDSCRCDNCGCDTCPPCCDTCENMLTQINLDKSCNIYPNPTSEELTITSDYNIKALEIYNEVGVKVREILLNTQTTTINVSDLTAGNYVIKLLTSRGTATKKFVKK
ncbi:MAG: T9SS type A sorting domain-containing protein [Bacteroidales bacterium]|jgi:hypothetical protein|nr:T9SS type A sorting domain-containing protein [Bacteroidales bacterium]